MQPRPDVIAPSRPAGQEGADEVASKGEASEVNYATHGEGNVIPFPFHRKPRGRCCLCGDLLGDGDGFSACRTCNTATDLTARIEWLLEGGAA